MFRRLLSLGVPKDIVPLPFGSTQVRWRHKPRWLPVAKSKMFRVPERKRLPSDEAEEIRRLYNIYRTQMTSLKHYFSKRTKARTTGEEVLAEIAKREEVAHQVAVSINDEWNASIAKHREAILAAEREKENLDILEAVGNAKAAALNLKIQAEEIVRLEKERAASYITPECIDAAIDKAMNNLTEYDFAINLNEKIFHGRTTKFTEELETTGNKVAASA